MLVDELKNIFASAQFAAAVPAAIAANEWFCARDIATAVDAIEGEFLDERKFADFLKSHPVPLRKKRVGVVCAGNIPLVGFGDMFYGLAAGYQVTIKPSSRDVLMRQFAPLVGVVGSLEQLADVEQIWVMGSDATCELLRDMYPEKRVLARASRHSVAVLDGSESEAEIAALADDIFLYCGMGCRSVSHIYLPMGFAVDRLQFPVRDMPQSWADSVRYQIAVRTMRGEQFEDRGWYVLSQSGGGDAGCGAGDAGCGAGGVAVGVAVGVVSYSFYDTAPVLDTTRIQCIVAHAHTPFGHAQRPTLTDFANGLNPML